MTGRAAIWVAGAGGSVFAHAMMLGILSATLRPEPVQQQQMPASALDVQAYRLDRATAPERPIDSEVARRSATETTAMASGAIAQSRARATPVDAAVAHPLSAPVEPARQVGQVAGNLADIGVMATQSARLSTVRPAPLMPGDSAGTKLGEAEATRDSLASRPARPEPIGLALAPSMTLPPRSPAGAATLAAMRQKTDPLPSASPNSAPLASATAVAPAVPAQGLDTAPAAQAIPATQSTAPAATVSQAAAEMQHQPKRLKAALAFAGGGDGDIDPVSLAAFQSFVRPGDVGGSADGLRDGVSALLAQVPCARLQVGFDPDSATLQVNGHVPEADLRAPVLAALQAKMGADITISDKILILPRPQCGALTGIAKVGLPQSTDQITNPLLIGADTHTRVLDFVADDRLFFDLTAPDYDAYIYVDYFDAGGNVLHLVPNDRTPLRLVAAETAFRVGASAPEDEGLQIFIGPPYGQEIAVAFAASAPLYYGLRPLQEPTVAYLEWLRTRVAKARDTNPDFKGEWVYFFVTTAER